MRKVLIIAAILAPLALGACSTTKYDNDPMYDAGFGDGCATGTARSQGAPPSSPVRDDADWENSDAYRAGWKAGYGACNTAGRSDSMGHDRDPTSRY